MTAQEMFEELGFSENMFLNEKNEKIIVFYNNRETLRIKFYKEEKCYKVDFLGFCTEIDMKLHKAINQKLKELGWLDD